MSGTVMFIGLVAWIVYEMFFKSDSVRNDQQDRTRDNESHRDSEDQSRE